MKHLLCTLHENVCDVNFFFIAESVSRMIADLPPKRVTRRLVFEAPNGNNQATINSVSTKYTKSTTINNYFPIGIFITID